MSLETLTDAQIEALIICPKRIQNPRSASRQEAKHVRRDFRVISEDGRNEFVLFTRQSTVIAENFSAGLRWRSRTGEEVILIRCNGSDHAHGNGLEKEQFGPGAHVHRATERYILAGKKAESFAVETRAYATLEGALHELMRLSSISGLETRPDERDLFSPT